MAKSTLELAKANLAYVEEKYSFKSVNAETLVERASAAAQVAMAEELNRIANALWMLVEQNAKK